MPAQDIAAAAAAPGSSIEVVTSNAGAPATVAEFVVRSPASQQRRSLRPLCADCAARSRRAQVAPGPYVVADAPSLLQQAGLQAYASGSAAPAPTAPVTTETQSTGPGGSSRKLLLRAA